MYSIEGLGLNHSALKHQTIHLRAYPAYDLNCCDGIFVFTCLKMKCLLNHLKSSPKNKINFKNCWYKVETNRSLKSFMKAKSPVKIATNMFCKNGSFSKFESYFFSTFGLCILVAPNDKTHIRHGISLNQKIFYSNLNHCLITFSQNIFHHGLNSKLKLWNIFLIHQDKSFNEKLHIKLPNCILIGKAIAKIVWLCNHQHEPIKHIFYSI